MAKYIVIAGAVPMLHDRCYNPKNERQISTDNRELNEEYPYVKMGDILDESFFKEGEIGDLVKGKFIAPHDGEAATEAADGTDGEADAEATAKKTKAKA